MVNVPNMNEPNINKVERERLLIVINIEKYPAYQKLATNLQFLRQVKKNEANDTLLQGKNI